MKKFKKEITDFISYTIAEKLNQTRHVSLDDSIKNLSVGMLFILNFIYNYEKELKTDIYENIENSSFRNSSYKLIQTHYFIINKSRYYIAIYTDSLEKKIPIFKRKERSMDVRLPIGFKIEKYYTDINDSETYIFECARYFRIAYNKKIEQTLREIFNDIKSKLTEEVKLWYFLKWEIDLDEILKI